MSIFDVLKKLITPVKNPIEVSESVQKIDLPYQNEESILVIFWKRLSFLKTNTITII